LIVVDTLAVEDSCRLFLPALRELKLGSLEMGDWTTIEIPALKILHFIRTTGPGVKTRRGAPLYLKSRDLDPGSPSSRNISPISVSPSPSTTLVTLLTKSPKLTHATLRFVDWVEAQNVLSHLVGFETETSPRSVENETLCPGLSELRLDFMWKLSEFPASKKWLVDALKSRNEAGLMVPLSIYAGWKGQETHVPLTCG
jgi:hypothetical protein